MIGVCSTRNVDRIRSISAEYVIDYPKEDFTQCRQRYDLIFDNIAIHAVSDFRHALTPQGIIISNSGHGGTGYVFKAFVLSPFMRQLGSMYFASPNKKGLAILKKLIQMGKVSPVTDQIYPPHDSPEAFHFLEEEHPREKVVIPVKHNNKTWQNKENMMMTKEKYKITKIKTIRTFLREGT